MSAQDVQHLFLQSILSRGMTSERMARVLHSRCFETVKTLNPDLGRYRGDQDAWEAFIVGINQGLDALDLSIKFMQDEITGDRKCMLVNLKSDENTQLATSYSILEIAYFKSVVEQIMLAPREAFCISSMAALRERTHVKGNLTSTQAESVLASFVANEWLLRSQRGKYSLSLKTILELAPYLKDNYEDQLNECTICHELVTKGWACNRANCTVRLHKHCFASYTARNAKSKCPSCQSEWKDKDLRPIGEEAWREGDESRRRAPAEQEESDEEEEEQEQDEDMHASQSQSQSQGRKSQRKSRASQSQKGKKPARKAVAESDEEEEEEEEEEEVKDEEESEEEAPTQRSRRSQRRK